MSDTLENYSVIYSPEAIEDLREIFIHISHVLQEPAVAQKQIERIRKEIRSLDFMPLRYTAVDWEPWKSMKMHKIPVDNFVAYYAVNTETHIVTVIRIFYGGRDVESIINKQDK